MLECKGGIAEQALIKLAGQEAFSSLTRVIQRELDKVPRVNPPPDDVPSSSDFRKLFTAAAKLQRKRNDTYLGADVLLLAALDTKVMQDALAEAGVSKN
jgi:ATP-dependent Clp protease ATP-binding subunit ClpB